MSVLMLPYTNNAGTFPTVVLESLCCYSSSVVCFIFPLQPLDKKIPENPKYKHIKSTIDTGEYML